jgi:hypothetical protein
VCPSDGILWPLQTVLPPAADGPGVVITTEASSPSYLELGTPELSPYRADGPRLAFYRVAARDGRLLARP